MGRRRMRLPVALKMALQTAGAMTGFAYAGGFFGAVDDVNFDLWSFVDARHLIVVEIGLQHAAAVDGDGVFHEGGDAVDGRAFDLRSDAVGIDGAAAVDGVNDAMHMDLAVFDTDFGDARGVGLEGKISGDAAKDARGQRLVPTGFFGG
jgi:hypothetical protein